MIRFAVMFSAIMLAFDVAGAFVAHVLGIDFGNFVFVAALAYVFFGFYAGRILRSWRALVSIVIAAVVDATLGTYFSTNIDPGIGASAVPEITAFGTAVYLAIALTLGAVGVATGVRASRSIAS